MDFIVGFLIGSAVVSVGAIGVYRWRTTKFKAESVELASEVERLRVEAADDLRAATAEIAVLTERVSSIQELSDSQLKAAEQRIELVQADRKQLRDELRSISADVLKETSKSLAAEFEERREVDAQRSKTEIEQRTEEIKRLVDPVNLKLTQVETKFEAIEGQRKEADGQLRELLTSLGRGVGQLATEAGGLSSALKKPHMRGSWGEIHLRNVIEMAGMVDHCDFVEQQPMSSIDGRLIPDVLVRLPADKIVVVDAKVPAEAFLEAQEASSDEFRLAALQTHARHVRTHVDALASKSYQSQFDNSPDLVVMFIPSDGIYHSALDADPGLLDYAVGKNVLIATPLTLIALLKAINYGWQQELIAESAREIAEIGRELHRRMATFVEPLAKVGRQLGSAVESYNRAVGSFDQRVVPQLKRIESAGVGSGKSVAPLVGSESVPRPITSQLEAAVQGEDVGNSSEAGSPHDGPDS